MGIRGWDWLAWSYKLDVVDYVIGRAKVDTQLVLVRPRPGVAYLANSGGAKGKPG